MHVKKSKQERERAYGKLILVETQSGDLSVTIEVPENSAIPETSLNHIRFALTGMAFLYEHDKATVDTIGEAYLSGVRDAYRLNEHQKKQDAKDKHADSPSVGFTATLKQDRQK